MDSRRSTERCTVSIMNRLTVALVAVILPLAIAISRTSAESTEATAGPVVAVGGGGTPSEVLAEILRLARERSDAPIVAVIPFASAREEAGEGLVEFWGEAGAASVVLITDDESAADNLRGADVIWMGGGSQNRLLDTLERLDLVDIIRARHASGAIVGGTSAGAAVLGAFTIAGDPDPEPYAVGGMEGRPALDLVPGTIVDQHFRERKREGRLLTAVLDAGGVLGLGICERTAAVIHGDSVRVLGNGVVIAFDARAARIDRREPDALRSASGVLTSVHPTGTKFSIAPRPPELTGRK